MVHRQQMIFPGRVENLQHQRPLHPPHLGTEMIFDDRRQTILEMLAIEAGELARLRFICRCLAEPSGDRRERVRPVRAVFEANASSGSSLTSRQFGEHLVGRRLFARLFSIKQGADFVALLALQVFEVQIDVEALAQPTSFSRSNRFWPVSSRSVK